MDFKQTLFSCIFRRLLTPLNLTDLLTLCVCIKKKKTKQKRKTKTEPKANTRGKGARFAKKHRHTRNHSESSFIWKRLCCDELFVGFSTLLYPLYSSGESNVKQSVKLLRDPAIKIWWRHIWADSSENKTATKTFRPVLREQLFDTWRKKRLY